MFLNFSFYAHPAARCPDVLHKDEAKIENVDEITQTADEEFPDSEKINNQLELLEEAEEPEGKSFLLYFISTYLPTTL